MKLIDMHVCLVPSKEMNFASGYKIFLSYVISLVSQSDCNKSSHTSNYSFYIFSIKFVIYKPMKVTKTDF